MGLSYLVAFVVVPDFDFEEKVGLGEVEDEGGIGGEDGDGLFGDDGFAGGAIGVVVSLDDAVGPEGGGLVGVGVNIEGKGEDVDGVHGSNGRYLK